MPGATDANPAAGTGKKGKDLTFTMHLLDPTQDEYLFGSSTDLKARVPKRKYTWPPVIV